MTNTEYQSPWGDTIYADTCWACDKPLTGPVAIVDAANPKAVHDNPICRTALSPL